MQVKRDSWRETWQHCGKEGLYEPFWPGTPDGGSRPADLVVAIPLRASPETLALKRKPSASGTHQLSNKSAIAFRSLLDSLGPNSDIKGAFGGIPE